MFGFGFPYNTINPSSDGGAFDPDAEAFFTAASITDATQKSAVNQLVLDLKSYNIWTKMTALYPIVGGSASSHAVNLKTPGTYNLTFATGVTHSSTGMTGNGTTGYANTNYNISSLQNSNHISMYIRTNINETSVDMGVYSTFGGGTFFDIESRYTDVAYFGNHVSLQFVSFSNTDSKGFYINTRTSSTLQKVFLNNTSKGTNTSSTSINFNLNMFLLCRNNALTPSLYSTKQCAFASIGDGLTDTDASNFYTAVNTYQTTLSRNV